MKYHLILTLLLLCSCNTERIRELEDENNELRQKVSELADENEEQNERIIELEEKMESAQSCIDDARFNLLNGQFQLGIYDLDDAESELDY